MQKMVRQQQLLGTTNEWVDSYCNMQTRYTRSKTGEAKANKKVITTTKV